MGGGHAAREADVTLKDAVAAAEGLLSLEGEA